MHTADTLFIAQYQAGYGMKRYRPFCEFIQYCSDKNYTIELHPIDSSSIFRVFVDEQIESIGTLYLGKYDDIEAYGRQLDEIFDKQLNDESNEFFLMVYEGGQGIIRMEPLRITHYEVVADLENTVKEVNVINKKSIYSAYIGTKEDLESYVERIEKEWLTDLADRPNT